MFEEGSEIEEIGGWCFQNSGLKEIILPKGLKEVGYSVFDGCEDLKTIYVENGCEIDLSCTEIPNSTKVGPPPETIVGSVMVWELRNCKEVIIPNGAKRIGDRWFWGTTVESITFSTSVKEIGVEAFCNCKNLKQIIFSENS